MISVQNEFLNLTIYNIYFIFFKFESLGMVGKKSLKIGFNGFFKGESDTFYCLGLLAQHKFDAEN